jgi:hypothetical protein
MPSSSSGRRLRVNSSKKSIDWVYLKFKWTNTSTKTSNFIWILGEGTNFWVLLSGRVRRWQSRKIAIENENLLCLKAIDIAPFQFILIFRNGFTLPRVWTCTLQYCCATAQCRMFLSWTNEKKMFLNLFFSAL